MSESPVPPAATPPRSREDARPRLAKGGEQEKQIPTLLTSIAHYICGAAASRYSRVKGYNRVVGSVLGKTEDTLVWSSGLVIEKLQRFPRLYNQLKSIRRISRTLDRKLTHRITQLILQSFYTQKLIELQLQQNKEKEGSLEGHTHTEEEHIHTAISTVWDMKRERVRVELLAQFQLRQLRTAKETHTETNDDGLLRLLDEMTELQARSLDALKAQGREKDIMLARLREQQCGTQQEAVSLRDKLRTTSQRVCELEVVLMAKEAELVAVRNRVSTMQGVLETELTRLKKECGAYKTHIQQIEGVKEKGGTEKTEIENELEKEVSQLKKELELAIETHTKQSNELAATMQRLESEQKTLAEQAALVPQLETRCKEAEEAVYLLYEQCKALTTERDSLSADNATLREKVIQVESYLKSDQGKTCKELEISLAKANFELVHCHVQLDDYVEEVAALKSKLKA